MKILDLIFFGGGLGSSRSLTNLLFELRKKKTKQEINIGIIDENLNNIPGGIAYSKDLSTHGFFNNPCRLSPKEFVSWSIKKENKNKLFKSLSSSKSISFNSWITKNKDIFKKTNSIKSISEIYFPRFYLSYWLEDILSKELNLKKSNIKIFFISGKISLVRSFKTGFKISILKGKNIKRNCFIKKRNLPILNNQKLVFGKKLIISLGLPSPNNPYNEKVLKDKNFIKDLYSGGGTKQLINLINSKIKIRKKIVLHFLGSKAGFLECLPELRGMIVKKKLDISIISTSRNATVLQPAIKSQNFKNYKFKIFTSSNISKIKNPLKLYICLKKEFNLAKKSNYFKYDVWTKVLQNKILNKVIKNFSSKDKIIYNEKYFKKIRQLTRFTFPETVFSYDYLKKKKYIKMNKAKVLNINKVNRKFKVTTLSSSSKKREFFSDIVISVKGPQTIRELVKFNPLYNCLYKMNNGLVYDDGFATTSDFELKNCKNIFLIGFVSSGYNARRETIVKAINNNAIKVSKRISKSFYSKI